jgi:ParB/Sulfiredoxin domain
MNEPTRFPSRLAVTYRPVGDLLPDPRNARTHPKRQIEQLRASIEAFGFTNPILADPDGRIIAGHGRLQAARAMGLAEVPTITLSGLSETQKRALLIADNKIALNAGWDLEILRKELGELGMWRRPRCRIYAASDRRRSACRCGFPRSSLQCANWGACGSRRTASRVHHGLG